LFECWLNAKRSIRKHSMRGGRIKNGFSQRVSTLIVRMLRILTNLIEGELEEQEEGVKPRDVNR